MQFLSTDTFSSMHMNWFDAVVALWLLFGIFRGRKNGMSHELLPLVQWIAVIVCAGFLYLQIARPLAARTGLPLLPCALLSYVFIGCTVYGLLGKLKKKLDDTFQEGDYFGKGEYYLGMTSGFIRFSCVLVAFIAVNHGRIISKAERDATLKMQKQAFEDIRFPTYGEVQNAVLFESATGNLICGYMPDFLIRPVNPFDAPAPRKINPMRAVAKIRSSSSSSSSTSSESSGSTKSEGGLKITFNH